MSGEVDRVSEAAATLRRLFDKTFAEPPASTTSVFEDLLAIRIEASPFVLRLSEVAGLFADRKVTPVPSPVSELIGITGLRGKMAPVYDLGALLGYSALAVPRWFVLARGPAAIGLAFETFEAHVRVPATSVPGTDADSSTQEHTRGLVQVGAALRPIVHITSVLEAITRRARADIASREG